jgi:hypothetical protein
MNSKNMTLSLFIAFLVLSFTLYAQAAGNLIEKQMNPILLVNEVTKTQETNPYQTVKAVSSITCDYKIPNENKNVVQSLIMDWAKNATVQSFTFNFDTIDAQLHKLKACFTDKGWKTFNSDLQASGNLNAIKSKQLNLSSYVDGEGLITEINEHEWKISLPLNSVYQNATVKTVQPLRITLILELKKSGELGIATLVATPR